MKIAVLGANNSIGSKIVLKAEEQGIASVCVVDSFSIVPGNGKVLIKPCLELTKDDVKDCHYVIDTISFLSISKFSSDDLPLWHLLEILKDSEVKLLELGSCTFLYSDSTRQRYVGSGDNEILDDSELKHERLCINAYKRLSLCRNVKWSVLCPPLLLDKEGYASGKFEFHDDVLPVGLEGDSFISEADFSSSVIELLKRIPKFHTCTSVRGLRA